MHKRYSPIKLPKLPRVSSAKAKGEPCPACGHPMRYIGRVERRSKLHEWECPDHGLVILSEDN